MEPDEDSLAQSEELNQLIPRLDALLAPLPKPPQGSAELKELYESAYGKDISDLIGEISQGLGEIERLSQALAEAEEELEAERDSLSSHEPTLRALAPLEEKLRSLLTREYIAQAGLPEDWAEKSFDDVLAEIEERQAAIASQLAQIEPRREELSSTWHHRLRAWRAACRDKSEELEVLSSFAETDYTFMIEGWMPESSVPQVMEALENEVGDDVMLNEMEVGHEEMEEHAPIVLENPAPSKPFEFLIALLGLPRHGTVDPTVALSLFLPLFFGLVVGDVAYGVVLVALALFLLRRVKPGSSGHSLGMVLAFCGGWTIVFGFIYGEFIGNVGEHLFHMPALLRRTGEGAVTSIFILALSVGAIHMLLGLVLGVWSALRGGKRSELMERGGTLIALLALIFLIGTFVDLLPQAFMTPMVVVLIVGLVILIASFRGIQGLVMGPLELMKTVGNILSYLRLAAIGLASVYLAEVANEIAGAIGNVVLGAIIAGFLHILNIVMGAISPSIQSLRLHYVEFFGKFYEMGGRQFTPFRRAGFE